MRMVAVGGDEAIAAGWGALSLIFAGLFFVSLLRSIGPSAFHMANPARRASDLGWTVDRRIFRSRTTTIIGLAFVCACIGFAVAFAVGARAGWPHQLDRINFDDDAIVWATALLGGGIGWLIGAVSGWIFSRHAIEPSDEGLGLAAVLVALFAFAALNMAGWHSASVAAQEGEPEAVIKLTTVIMFAAGAALVIVTLLVLAQENRFRQAGAVVGAIVAVTILVGAGMRFSSLLPIDRAWLNAWQMHQADAESFAPNLLTPASSGCPEVPVTHFSFETGPNVFIHSGRPWWLEGHVPRWLPDGFGLLTWSRLPESGVWADGRCRLVRLTIVGYQETHNFRQQDRLPVRAGIGSWSVAERPCPSAFPMEGLCLEYQAWSRGEGDLGGVTFRLRLQTLGIDRETGDRIALGIPVSTAKSIGR